MPYLYLIMLAAPLPGTAARYYLGSTIDLARRLNQHRTGKGSPMIRRAVELGIGIQAIAWKKYKHEARARRTEARLKRGKSNARALAWMRRNGANITGDLHSIPQGRQWAVWLLPPAGEPFPITVEVVGAYLGHGEAAQVEQHCALHYPDHFIGEMWPKN
jgi:predicted GIY-YIG superfamily endonuclease